MEFFVGLLIALVVIALLGHGLWMLGELVIKGLFGEAPPVDRRLRAPQLPDSARAACPVCTAALAPGVRGCEHCGWPHHKPNPEQGRKIALERLRRQAAGFKNAGWLDDRTFTSIVHSLEAGKSLDPNAAPIPLAEAPAEADAAPQFLANPVVVERDEAPLPPLSPRWPGDPLHIAVKDDRAQANAAQEAIAPDTAAAEMPVAEPAPYAGRIPPPLPRQQPAGSSDLNDRVAAFAAARSENIDLDIPLAPLAPSQAAQYQAAPSSPAARPASASAPRAAQPPFSKLLASFLEEKNIRWGELIGGLLIIGSSIALVRTFWEQIAERDVLKFGLFNGVTAALFGIGLYVHRRWRLPTTTEGVLLIAVLLVPLNFLAIAAATLDHAVTSPLAIGGELASIGLFALLTLAASRILVEENRAEADDGASPDASATQRILSNTAPLAMTVAVVGCAAWQLIVRRFVDAGAPLAELAAMGLVPVAAYGGNVVWGARRIARCEPCGETEAHRLFKIVGTTLFAALLPLGVLVVKTGMITTTLARLAPMAALVGAPLVAAGLVLRRRLAGKGLEGHRVAATALAVAGTGLMLGAVALGWPRPAGMLPTALVNAGLFAWIAWRSNLPAAHLPAALSGVFGYLLAFHLFVTKQLSWANEQAATAFTALVSGLSGTALVPAVLAMTVPLWFAQRRLRADGIAESEAAPRESAPFDDGSPAFWYAASAGLTAVASLALVASHSLGVKNDTIHATWVYAVYAIAAILAAARTGKDSWGYAGGVLLWAAWAQGLAFRYVEQLDLKSPWPYVFLSHATVALAAAWWFDRRPTWRRGAAEPIAGLAQASAVLVVPLLGYAAYRGVTFDAAGGFTWLAVLGAMIVARTMSRQSYAAFQACGFAAAAQWAYYFVGKQPWFHDPDLTHLRSLDPRTWQAIGIAWSGLCLAWLALRRAVYRQEASIPAAAAGDGPLAVIQPAHMPCAWSRLLAHDGPMVDRGIARALVGLAVAMALVAVVPGLCQELSPRNLPATAPRIVPPLSNFELLGLPHAAAYGLGSWLLLAGVAAVVLYGLGEWFRPSKWAALAMLGVAAALLIAARFETEVAAASALRWTTSLAFCLLSVPLWLPAATIARAGQVLGVRRTGDAGDLRRQMFWVVLGLSLAPQALMIVGLSGAAIDRYPAAAEMLPSLFACVTIGLVGGALSGLLLHLQEQHKGSASGGLSTLGGSVLGILSVAPLVAMIIFITAVALKASPVLGPDPISWFFRAGTAVSYAVPVLVIAATLIGHAIAGGSHATAFAASIVLNLGATAGYLLATAAAAGPGAPLEFDLSLWLRLAQLNGALTAVYAVVWLWASRDRRVGVRAEGVEGPGVDDSAEAAAIARPVIWQSIEAGLAAALAAVAVGLPALAIAARPPMVPAAVIDPVKATAADWAAWGGLAAAIAAVVSWFRRADRPVSVAAWSLIVLGIVTLGALGGARFDQGNLLADRLLVVGWVVTAIALVGAGLWAERGRSFSFGPAGAVARWSTALLGASVVTATLGLFELEDLGPQIISVSSAWYGLPLAATVAALIVLAWWVDSRWRLCAAAFALEILAFWWSNEMFADWIPTPHFSIEEMGWVILIGLALPTPLWLWIDRTAARSRDSVLSPGKSPRHSHLAPLHRVTAGMALGLLLLYVAGSLELDLAGHHASEPLLLRYLATTATFIAVASCLWDRRAIESIATLYIAGLVVMGVVLDELGLSPHLLIFVGVMFLAAYGLATSYLWSRREGLAAIAAALGIRPQGGGGPPHRLAAHRWMIGANFALAVVIVAAAYQIVLGYEEGSQRWSAALAVVAQGVAVGLLARGERRSILQSAALHLGVLGILAFGWALVDPATEGSLLNRAVVATAALAAAIGLYGLGFSKLLRRENEWTAAAARLVPRLIACTAGALAFVLATEAYQFFYEDGVKISPTAIAAVALALAGLVAASLAAALLPGRDPLGLSEKGRTAYVYAAEAILALLFMHIRLTMPWLFHGWFMRYWPVIVMVLAFGGVGLGEFFRRRRRGVLSEPLERTGAFLPLLPVAGFWILPSTEVHYSLLLLAVGLLYGVLSVARKSFGFGVLATLAANGGLWYFLAETDRYGLLEHPQLWLIPPSLCVLIAAHLNRRSLGEEQLTTIRYGAASTIYIASTADIFLAGVAEAWGLPLVLGGLSLVGIFAGIAMRIRAFLFLGTGFLMLALMTIIWRAGYYESRTWIFYVTGIVAGVLIIALFAVFEKKRQEVLRLIDELREWER